MIFWIPDLILFHKIDFDSVPDPLTTRHKQTESCLIPVIMSETYNQWPFFRKNKIHADLTVEEKASLLIRVEVAGVRFQKIQTPVHANLW